MPVNKNARAKTSDTAAPRTAVSAKAKAQTAPSPEIVPAVTTPDRTATPAGKLGVLVTLLIRPEGTTIREMSEATGWQSHSVRGALSGALKKTRGFSISSEAAPKGRIYRITPATAASGMRA